MRVTICCLSSFVLLFPAMGAAASIDAAALHSRLDANNDGYVTANEIPEKERRLFERLLRIADRNGDGKLDVREMANGLAEKSSNAKMAGDPDAATDRVMEVFKLIDVNGDGSVSAAEVPSQYSAEFERLLKAADRNGDKAITRDEVERMIRKRANAEDRPGGARVGKMIAQFFDQADADKDGKISKREAPPVLRQGFAAADVNGDGFLSREEVRRYLEARALRRKEAK